MHINKISYQNRLNRSEAKGPGHSAHTPRPWALGPIRASHPTSKKGVVSAGGSSLAKPPPSHASMAP
jgi:hypothetical protein